VVAFSAGGDGGSGLLEQKAKARSVRHQAVCTPTKGPSDGSAESAHRKRCVLTFASTTNNSPANAFTVVQKIALTAIVDQAHNSNERPRLRGAARRSRRLGKFCRIAFTRRSSSAQITSGGWGHVSLKLTWV